MTTVEVTSPIGDVMAAGRSVPLTAVAQTASGDPVSGQAYDWESSDPSVATVDGTGRVAGVAAGSATITATTGEASGSLTLRVVEADLETIQVLLDDIYTASLVANLGSGSGDAVAEALDSCATALVDGDVLGLDECLQTIQDETSSDPTDQALLAVLGVITERSAQLLNL
ncbi:MAG: Ig-like domain-containing protein [Longimicrobiales bacterium]|nr:Ig-like domain-containing protein [Longimicrobiales bacterium]